MKDSRLGAGRPTAAAWLGAWYCDVSVLSSSGFRLYRDGRRLRLRPKIMCLMKVIDGWVVAISSVFP